MGRPLVFLLGLFLLLALAVAARAGPPASMAAARAGLGSADLRTRVEAVAYLATRTDAAERAEAVALLTSRLDDPEPLVRRDVANALAALRDRRAAPAVIARADREPSEEVLAALLVALGTLGGAADVPAALRRADDPRPAVRAAAFTALGDLGGDAARARLLLAVRDPGLPDPEWTLRAAALLALARCGRAEDVAPAITAYREGEGARRWLARAAVARLVGALEVEPVPALRRMVEDPDPRVAVTAADGLVRRGSDADVAALLAHAAEGARAAGAVAVGRARRSSDYPRLVALARLDPSRSVRWAAARSLFEAGDPAGDELVLEAVQAADPGVWAEAVEALTAATGARHGRDVAAWRAELAQRRSRR